MFAALSKGFRNDVSQTLNSRPSEEFQLKRTNFGTSPEEDDGSDLDMTPDESDRPLPLRSVLTKPVLITIANYAMLALLSTVLESCTPLVWSTPVEYGGLNMSPASIGMWMSLYGGVDGIFQLFLYPRYVNRFGLRRVFVSSISSCAVIFIAFPFENLAARAGNGANVAVWLLIILQLLSLCFFDSGYRESFPQYTFAHKVAYDVHGVTQLRYTCTFHRLFRTNGRSAPRMAYRRWRPRFKALLDRLLRAGCSRSP